VEGCTLTWPARLTLPGPDPLIGRSSSKSSGQVDGDDRERQQESIPGYRPSEIFQKVFLVGTPLTPIERGRNEWATATPVAEDETNDSRSKVQDPNQRSWDLFTVVAWYHGYMPREQRQANCNCYHGESECNQGKSHDRRPTDHDSRADLRAFCSVLQTTPTQDVSLDWSR
jgi:hypothetical protein